LRAALARLALRDWWTPAAGAPASSRTCRRRGVAELFELREALETQAARLAARRRDPAVFDALVADFARAGETLAASGIDAYYDAIARFDQAIDDAVGNAAFRAALDGVRTHLIRARRMAADNPARLLRAADEHRLICEAIRDGDEALAASATAVHLRASLTAILATLEARASQEGIR
jgi:DNA-binding GntR family transcriptional regulator